MPQKVVRKGHNRLLKKLRHYISDEHSGHNQYAKLAMSEGLNKTERRTIRSMGHDEAGHEQRLKKILREQ
jgi:rubrerythrin